MSEVRFIKAFQAGFFLISDGTMLRPNEIKGAKVIGSVIDESNTVLSLVTDENCVGGVCPIR